MILFFFFLADTFGELNLFSMISIIPTYACWDSASSLSSLDFPRFCFFFKLETYRKKVQITAGQRASASAILKTRGDQIH